MWGGQGCVACVAQWTRLIVEWVGRLSADAVAVEQPELILDMDGGVE